MLSAYRSRLGLNKFEVTILMIISLFILLFATVNIVWIAKQFGVHLTTKLTQKALDLLSSGASLGTVAAVILGVTLPGWAVAAAGALGGTAA
ncbi:MULTISPECIES: class IIc cyclic bacteriocin [Lactiplantibacillus]|uniref:Class IIc cyclic bacteriocin n=1 Tax=Lactiplantibacillus plajomi TaxID=1457217 RepID=A0ABV6K192_9LACO|nr:class IIc cyclic bacteriocin [Lactiplantibacillus plajomi]